MAARGLGCCVARSVCCLLSAPYLGRVSPWSTASVPLPDAISAPPRSGCVDRWLSAEARPQVVGADGDDQDAHYSADERVGEPVLEAGAGVRACQAADAQRDAGRPVGGADP
jgi:hypothetical protein